MQMKFTALDPLVVATVVVDVERAELEDDFRRPSSSARAAYLSIDMDGVAKNVAEDAEMGA